jgi:class 3 adenylate cyclase
MINMNLLFLILILLITITFFIVLIRQKKKNGELENLLTRTKDKLEDLQVNFGRFAPQEVIEQLTDADGRYKPSMRTVTVLFADLNGFTQMCDQLDPPIVVSILNGYFRTMSRAISENHGRVTELMGDGILALFGALVYNPWHVQDAVNGALAMRKALEEYNQELKQKSLPELSFGIGIHQGEVLAGVMGNFELSKFGVVGDTINVASRVEALTRKLGVDLLITDTVRDRIDDRYALREMKPMPVKGKKEHIKTYFVEGMKSDLQL